MKKGVVQAGRKANVGLGTSPQGTVCHERGGADDTLSLTRVR